MNDKISVIVPVYNVENYLQRCISSITCQSYDNLEIIIIDDGSTDTSGQICDDLAKHDKRIKVVHTINRGIGAARNTALEFFSGEYVLFVDSDDYIIGDIINDAYQLCKKYDADIVSFGYMSGKNTYYTKGELEIWSGKDAVRNMFIYNNIDSHAWCKLYRRYLFNNTRMSDGPFEDIPFTYRVLLEAKRIVSLKKTGYYCEKRKDSVTRSQIFTDKHLLYMDISHKVYEIIKRDYPEFEKYAMAFYLYSVISTAEHATECKKNYEYTLSRIEFDKQFENIIKSRYISAKKKAISILIKIKLYKLVKQIYMYWRGK